MTVVNTSGKHELFKQNPKINGNDVTRSIIN